MAEPVWGGGDVGGLPFNPLVLAWALVSLGYLAGLAISKLPLSPEGRGWGGYMVSYSLVTAAFLAVVGAGEALYEFAAGLVEGGVEPWVKPSELPGIYYNLTMNAFGIVAAAAVVGFGAAVIPIVGPALANVFSVVSMLPVMALTGTIILGALLAAFLTVFVTLAPLLIPFGVVLLAVPMGKLRGLGGWLIAMGIVLHAVAPALPAAGLLACQALGDPCTLEELVETESVPKGSFDTLVTWLTDPANNVPMKMWRFAIGSMVGFALMTAAAAALSRGIGGIASSLGFG